MLKYLVACLLLCSISYAGDYKTRYNQFTGKQDWVVDLTRDGELVYWGGVLLNGGSDTAYWTGNTSEITPVTDGVDVALTGDLRFDQNLSIVDVVSMEFVGDEITFSEADVIIEDALYYNLVVRTLTTSGNIVTGDQFVQCSASLMATLPTAVGVAGKVYHIKNISSGLVTISAQSGEQVEDTTSLQISRKTSVQLVSDGSEWRLI